MLITESLVVEVQLGGVQFFPYVTVGISAGTDGAREVCVCCKCCINMFCSFLHLLT